MSFISISLTHEDRAEIITKSTQLHISGQKPILISNRLGLSRFAKAHEQTEMVSTFLHSHLVRYEVPCKPVVEPKYAEVLRLQMRSVCLGFTKNLPTFPSELSFMANRSFVHPNGNQA